MVDPVRKTRVQFYEPATVKTSEPPLPWHLLSLPEAISRGLHELVHGDGKREPLGEKTVAGHFDGKDGREVAGSTVSRWITEPTRFPAHCLPTLAALHAEFRGYVFGYLAVRLVSPGEVMSALSPSAAKEYEKVVVEQCGPGRWVRR